MIHVGITLGEIQSESRRFTQLLEAANQYDVQSD